MSEQQRKYWRMMMAEGYTPDHKTRDQDLIIPIREPEEKEEPDDSVMREIEIVELLTYEEPDRRQRGMPRAHGKKWEDRSLPMAPEGWSPRS